MFPHSADPQLGDSDPLSRPKLERSPLVLAALVAVILIDSAIAGAIGVTAYRTYKTKQGTRRIQAIQVRQHFPKLERSKR